MITYKFLTREAKGNAVFLRVTNNRRSLEISLGISLSSSDLDDALSDNPTVRNMEYNKFFTDIRKKADAVKLRLMADGRMNEDVAVIRDMVYKAVFGIEAKSRAKTFVEFFLSVGETKSRSTNESFKYTASTMRKFRGDVERMRFDDVNYAWLSDFEDWMKRKELSQNTRKIHLGNIRIAMREAYKRELTENDPFRRFTFKPAKTRKRSLSLGQLRRIKDFPVEPYAEIYRDMFMLIFYLCGINIIDLYSLKEISGEGRIEYRRAKTGRLYSIKVEPEAMSIIERYRGDKALLCLADRWSDYKNFARQMNKALANIGEVKRSGLGGKKTVTPIEKDLTSYWARHTWATIAADIDIPDAVISMALGHSGENRVTDIYIDRNMRKVDAANRKVIDRVLKGMKRNNKPPQQ